MLPPAALCRAVYDCDGLRPRLQVALHSAAGGRIAQPHYLYSPDFSSSSATASGTKYRMLCPSLIHART